MKKTTILYALLLSAGSFIMLQSFSGGPAGSGRNQTGALSSNNCSQCHSDNNNFNSSSTIQVTDAGGNVVTSYDPGVTYTVTFSLAATGASGYGMQMLILDAGNASVGTLSSSSSNAKTTSLAGRVYFEHNARSTSNIFTASWTAPAAGTGNVTMYGSGMAVNGNGGTSGDDPTPSITVSLTESGTINVNTIEDQANQFNIFPVPNNGTFSIENKQNDAIEYVRILTLTGAEVSQQQVYVPAGATGQLRFNDLAPGVYQVVAEGKASRQARTIVVQ